MLQGNEQAALCACLCVCKGRSEDHFRHPQEYYLPPLRPSLSLVWSSQVGLDHLASSPLGASCLCLPSAWSLSVPHARLSYILLFVSTLSTEPSLGSLKDCFKMNLVSFLFSTNTWIIEHFRISICPRSHKNFLGEEGITNGRKQDSLIYQMDFWRVSIDLKGISLANHSSSFILISICSFFF